MAPWGEENIEKAMKIISAETLLLQEAVAKHHVMNVKIHT